MMMNGNIPQQQEKPAQFYNQAGLAAQSGCPLRYFF
jgi:hypothetical protein